MIEYAVEAKPHSPLAEYHTNDFSAVGFVQYNSAMGPAKRRGQTSGTSFYCLKNLKLKMIIYDTAASSYEQGC